MGDIEFKAKFGITIKATIVFIVIIGIFLIVYPLLNGRSLIVEIVIGIIFILFGLLIVSMVIFTRFVFTDEGLRIKTPATFFMFREDYLENTVPYSSITDYHETRDVTHTVAFSFDALRINYIKTNGRKDSFVISPADKSEFISELGRRTGKQLNTAFPKKQ